MNSTTAPATSDFLLLSRGQWDKGADKAEIEAAIDNFETPEA